MCPRWYTLLLLCLSLLIMPMHARANETDQFTLPDEELADLGLFFSLNSYRVLNGLVEKTNQRIDRALKINDRYEREGKLERLHSGGYLADQVRAHYGPGFYVMNAMDDFFRSKKARRAFDGRLLAYRPPNWIYEHAHLPIDPRRVALLFKSSTIKAYGSYFGTDKLGHFYDLGHLYYKAYLGRQAFGQTPEEAMKNVLDEFTKGPISERAVIGVFATGVNSNADLAANYLGMKFYQNLTEPVMLKGEMQPPLLVRDGEYWRLNDHVYHGSDFFKIFISDHFNEALNPCIYEWSMRDAIAQRMQRDARKILDVYVDASGRRRTAEDFDELAQELAEYYGEDYGHTGVSDKMILISQECFPEPIFAGAAQP